MSMTKKQYLLIRDMEEIPMSLWYEFYEERAQALGYTQILVYESFVEIFTMILHHYLAAFNVALQAFYAYYNKKFNLEP